MLGEPRYYQAAALEKVIPEMQFYAMEGGVPTACLCRNGVCLPPITKPQVLVTELTKLSSQKARQ